MISHLVELLRSPISELPLVEHIDKRSKTHESTGDSETLDVSWTIGSGPEKGSVNRSQVSDTINQGDTDSPLLSSIKHGDHPRKEEGNSGPYTGTTETDEGISNGNGFDGNANDEGDDTP